MCTPVEDGFIMTDGIKVTKKQILEGNVSDRHYIELRKTSIDVIDGVFIRHNLHELRNDLQKVFTPEVINPMINKRLMSIFFGASKIVGAAGVIVTAAYALYSTFT